MARGQHHVIGLDIGNCSIKAVELQRTGSGIEVLGRPVIVPTPERSVEGGVIVDSAAVADAVRRAVELGGFKTKKVIASVGGESSVVVRISEVPRMSGKELEEAIQWELDRQTPFPVDQSTYDYHVIEAPDADPNAQNMEVLIAVAQDDMVNAHVEAIMSARLTPKAIDVEPLAIGRSLVDVASGAFADQTVGIVHIGASATTIMIVRKCLLSFVRQVPIAGNTMTQSIRQNFMGDERLSEQVKRAYSDLSEGMYDQDGEYVGADGFGEGGGDGVFGDEVEAVDSVFEPSDAEIDAPGDQPFDEAEAAATQLDVTPPEDALPPADGAAISRPAEKGPEQAVAVERSEEERATKEIVCEAIIPNLVDLANEIRRSLDFYRRQHRNEEVDRIILSGGSAVMPGVDAFVANEVGINAVVADPFSYLIVNDEELSREYLRDIGPAMTVAVGLALRDMVD